MISMVMQHSTQDREVAILSEAEAFTLKVEIWMIYLEVYSVHSSVAVEEVAQEAVLMAALAASEAALAVEIILHREGILSQSLR